MKWLYINYLILHHKFIWWVLIFLVLFIDCSLHDQLRFLNLYYKNEKFVLMCLRIGAKHHHFYGSIFLWMTLADLKATAFFQVSFHVSLLIIHHFLKLRHYSKLIIINTAASVVWNVIFPFLFLSLTLIS